MKGKKRMQPARIVYSKLKLADFDLTTGLVSLATAAVTLGMWLMGKNPTAPVSKLLDEILIPTSPDKLFETYVVPARVKGRCWQNILMGSVHLENNHLDERTFTRLGNNLERSANRLCTLFHSQNTDMASKRIRSPIDWTWKTFSVVLNF